MLTRDRTRLEDGNSAEGTFECHQDAYFSGPAMSCLLVGILVGRSLWYLTSLHCKVQVSSSLHWRDLKDIIPNLFMHEIERFTHSNVGSKMPGAIFPIHLSSIPFP